MSAAPSMTHIEKEAWSSSHGFGLEHSQEIPRLDAILERRSRSPAKYDGPSGFYLDRRAESPRLSTFLSSRTRSHSPVKYDVPSPGGARTPLSMKSSGLDSSSKRLAEVQSATLGHFAEANHDLHQQVDELRMCMREMGALTQARLDNLDEKLIGAVSALRDEQDSRMASIREEAANGRAGLKVSLESESSTLRRLMEALDTELGTMSKEMSHLGTSVSKRCEALERETAGLNTTFTNRCAGLDREVSSLSATLASRCDSLEREMGSLDTTFTSRCAALDRELSSVSGALTAKCEALGAELSAASSTLTSRCAGLEREVGHVSASLTAKCEAMHRELCSADAALGSRCDALQRDCRELDAQHRGETRADAQKAADQFSRLASDLEAKHQLALSKTGQLEADMHAGLRRQDLKRDEVASQLSAETSKLAASTSEGLAKQETERLALARQLVEHAAATAASFAQQSTKRHELEAQLIERMEALQRGMRDQLQAMDCDHESKLEESVGRVEREMNEEVRALSDSLSRSAHDWAQMAQQLGAEVQMAECRCKAQLEEKLSALQRVVTTTVSTGQTVVSPVATARAQPMTYTYGAGTPRLTPRAL